MVWLGYCTYQKEVHRKVLSFFVCSFFGSISLFLPSRTGKFDCLYYRGLSLCVSRVYSDCLFFCFVCFKRLRRRWLLLLLLRLWLNNNNKEEGDMEAALSFLAPTFPSLMPCSPPFSSGPPRRCATLRGFASEEEKGPWRGRK